jgi:hypothetical protein
VREVGPEHLHAAFRRRFGEPAKKKRGARPADADYPTVEAVSDGSADNYEWDEPGIVPPEEFRANILDTIERQRAVARAYKKILKKVLAVSSLDQASEDEVSAAISTLINTWQSLQRALARRAPPAAPIQPEIITAMTAPAITSARTLVKMPDLPEFLRRKA